jgi:amino acid transporter
MKRAATGPPDSTNEGAPRQELSLFDATSLILGIIIGAGIYQTAPDVARGAGSWWGVVGIWLLGGAVSLFGALGYAELAAAHPRQGGDYVYLTRAYGPWAGFLFGWSQLAVLRPGDIGVLAFVFATYASELYDPLAGSSFLFGRLTTQVLYAAGGTMALTAINIAGVRQGKWVQNLLTMIKVAGLLAIVGVALFAPAADPAGGPAEATGELAPFPFSVALILVLFTFGGWNEMAYVAAEVKQPKRNIVRALVLGTVGVTVIYLAVNGAFLAVLGYIGLASSEAVATDTVSTVLPNEAGRLISALICISALGSMNGVILTGARISYAMGSEHPPFHFLGRWNEKTSTPVRALVVQGLLASVLIFALGSFVKTIIYTAATVYSFYLATNVAVIVLRKKEPEVERPYRVTGYPVTTLIFCAFCGFLIYGAVTYRPWIALASVGVILLGLPLYKLSVHQRAKR